MDRKESLNCELRRKEPEIIDNIQTKFHWCEYEPEPDFFWACELLIKNNLCPKERELKGLN